MVARCFPAKRFPAVALSPSKNRAANRMAMQTAAEATIVAATEALAVVVAAAIVIAAIRSASAPRPAWIPPKQFFPQ
jgi:hypothetical protein